MTDPPAYFSKKLLAHTDAQHTAARTRIALAKRRIQSILDREVCAHQRTLEQKIADQGPTPLRVDPHLIGLAIMDLTELGRLRQHTHPATARISWQANPATPDAAVRARLDELAPLYASITHPSFGNLVGDALELIVFKCLNSVHATDRRFAYQGQFLLEQPKTREGRYRKIQPPRHLAGGSSASEADFFQFGHAGGPLCLECKNLREWLYPGNSAIRDLILKAHDFNSVPVLIARRIHYTTRRNLLEPAGIIAHETYLQYYPGDQEQLAAQVSHKRSLGFTDVIATEEPHPRTANFFANNLPKITEHMSDRWFKHRSALAAYARSEIGLAELYTAINSPGGGKWIPD